MMIDQQYALNQSGIIYIRSSGNYMVVIVDGIRLFVSEYSWCTVANFRHRVFKTAESLRTANGMNEQTNLKYFIYIHYISKIVIGFFFWTQTYLERCRRKTEIYIEKIDSFVISFYYYSFIWLDLHTEMCDLINTGLYSM